MSKKTKTIIGILIAVAVAGLLAFLLTDVIAAARQIDFPKFEAYILGGKINKIYIDGYNWTGELIENGKVVSDNFYIRGTEEGNYQAIKQMPKVSLKQELDTQKADNENWSGYITLKNTSQTPALMIRINVLGAEDGDQILPMFYSDNYFSLLPGEEKTVTFRWKDVDTRGNAPKVVVSGYNVK